MTDVPSARERMSTRLRPRLQQLSLAQDSIQALSMWLVHHRSEAEAAVAVWQEEVARGKTQ